MSAAKSQKNTDIPADLQPYYDAPSNGRVWARWAVRIVIFVILVCLAIIFVKWVWHQTHTGDNKKPATSTSQKDGNTSNTQGTSKPITLSGSAEDNTNSGEQSPNTAETNTANGNSGSAAQSVGRSTNLANTGPGQTIAIFLASSLLFTMLYELRLRSKTN